MKDNATHISLIRDDNGKPVEAQYLQEDGIAHRYWVMKANRIPVTGDWPTDKNVYAMDEVEPVPQWYNRFTQEWVNGTEYSVNEAANDGASTRTALRLKATLSGNRQSEVTVKGCDFKSLRKERRLTLRDVEAYTGISNAYLSQLENGKIKNPSYKVVETLKSFYQKEEPRSDFRTCDGLEVPCPECGGLRGGHGNRRCSKMTLEYAQQEIINVEQKWIKINSMAVSGWQKDRAKLKKQVEFFQSKVAVLKHENNKLRRFKQQYQQELIEKLNEERQYRSVPDQYVIDSIIEIIQSTK